MPRIAIITINRGPRGLPGDTLTGAQIVAAIDAQLGSTNWRTGGGSTPPEEPPFLFDYAPGDSIASLGTFSRAAAADFTAQDGSTQTAAPNVLRDNHWVGGFRTTLLE